MNAFLTLRGRRFLPLLAISCILSGSPPCARAGMILCHLTDRATHALANPSEGGLTAQLHYESQGEIQPPLHSAEPDHLTSLTALALTLIIPAGTTPMISDAPSPPPPLPPPPLQSSSSPSSPPPSQPPGDGHTAGSPEPGALLLALSGSGTALLTWLRRRRPR